MTNKETTTKTYKLDKTNREAKHPPRPDTTGEAERELTCSNKKQRTRNIDNQTSEALEIQNSRQII